MSRDEWKEEALQKTLYPSTDESGPTPEQNQNWNGGVRLGSMPKETMWQARPDNTISNTRVDLAPSQTSLISPSPRLNTASKDLTVEEYARNREAMIWGDEEARERWRKLTVYGSDGR